MLYAIVSNNCSIPGAEAAPIKVFTSRSQAEMAFAQGNYPTSCWVEEIPHEQSYLSEATGEWVGLPVLYVLAMQVLEYQDEGYVSTEHRVGFFPIPQDLPAFTWARAQVVQSSVYVNTLQVHEAWVIHNGKGLTYGEKVESDQPPSMDDFEPWDWSEPDDFDGGIYV